MDKIILLDWDGPISNSRTWKMRGQVDPVAIQMLNDLTIVGWKTMLTSTIRKNFRSEDPKAEATAFMRDAGFYVQWYDTWRTNVTYTGLRHLEVAQQLMAMDVPEDAIFLVVDDERFPHEFLQRGRMKQIYARSNDGIDALSIAEAYRVQRMNDQELAREFAESDEDWDE